ncbi:MAG: class I adenylate-forming enzyme family protein [Solirubrobacteraceae bacterium]
MSGTLRSLPSLAGITRTFAGPLERARRVAGAQPAVVCGEQRLTHAELYERVQRLVGALRAMGLAEGARVAVVGPNCHRYLELYLAVPAGGFVLVPLNARHTERELGYALEDSEASVLFATAAYRALEPAVDRFVELPDGYDAVLADSDSGWWGSIREDDLAGLFYTGGTTGAAKGVMLTHGNLVANAYHFMTCWPFSPETRWLVVAPMFHAAGTIGVLATVWAGGCHVIVPGFDPGVVLDAVERERVTATLVVPTMMGALADEQEQRPRDVSSLRWLSHGSSPVGTSVLRRTAAAFPDASLLHVYGLTETAPILTLLPDEQLLLDSPQARSCGRPAIGIELQVVDNAGRRPLPPGEVGEVRARGANVTAGYWNKREATELALAGGWLATGDLGYLDDAGHLFLVDRAKDMIISGGENVYCTEVEEALYSHSAVREAAVFGIPDERWGEAVHAVVVPHSQVSEEELLLHCRRLIAAYKVPKQIELTSEPLPKSGAGKILKRRLREPFWEGHETQVS